MGLAFGWHVVERGRLSARQDEAAVSQGRLTAHDRESTPPLSGLLWFVTHVFLVAVLLCGAALTSGCGSGEKEVSENIRVFVSVAPQAFFVKRIGGEQIDVGILVPPGQSMHSYEPTPQQMAQLERADVFFRIGVPFEVRLMQRVGDIIGHGHIIDTREGVRMRAIEKHGHDEPDAEKPPGHEAAADPHIWLDPILVKTQARTIAQALIGLDPSRETFYNARLQEFERELDSVDAVIRNTLAPFAGRAVYVFHPSYGYFTDRYGLRQVAIESEGKEPSARELGELIDQATADSVTAVFVQRQFAQKTAMAIAEAVGAKVISIDPLAEDYLDNLVEMANAMAEGLRKQGR